MKNAFSLVELAIVLVIIGLLSAGVSAGGKLIEQAKIREMIRLVYDADKAISIFNLTYGGLPGDLKNASDFSLGSNGDGDGKIEYYSGSDESRDYMWTHMDAAGLYQKIKFSSWTAYCGTPDGTKDFMLWKEDGPKIIDNSFHSNKYDNTQYSRMQILNGKDTKLNYSAGGNTYFGLSAKKSYFIDKKMDDGIANSGSITTDITVTYVDNEGDCGTASTYDIATNSDCITFYEFPSLQNNL